MIICLTFLSSVYAESQGLILIYDSKNSQQSEKASAKDITFIKRNAIPKDSKHWERGLNDCSEYFEVVGIAHGSFTKKSCKQKAILYKYCFLGHGWELNGIVIFEGNNIAKHIVFENTTVKSIFSLPDINRNGFAEIGVSMGSTHMGETHEDIELIELSGGKVNKFGRTETYFENCSGSPNEKGNYSTDYRIWVTPGEQPAYYSEATFIDCNENKTKKEPLKRVLLEKDKIDFEIIK